MVAAPLLDSSSGWACTAIRRSGSCGAEGNVVSQMSVGHTGSVGYRWGANSQGQWCTMSEASTPLPPADRYGNQGRSGRSSSPTPKGLGRRAKVAIGAALAAAVALTAWFAVEQTRRDPVSFDVVGFSVRSPEQVDVTFQVHMPPGMTAVCAVDALAESFAQVGTVDVPVGPSEDRTSQHTVTVRTSEQATSGVVDRCEPTP